MAETFSGNQVPVHPPSISSTPKSFVRQSLDAPPKNLERRYIDYEFWLEITQQQETKNDKTASLESIETFCNKLGTQAVNNENSVTLLEVDIVPPRMEFKRFV